MSAKIDTKILDGSLKSHEEWKKILAYQLSCAKFYEIHMWENETESIELALKYGHKKEFDWKHGTVVAGEITPEFIEMLLTLPKPEDTKHFGMLTPFFSIFLDSGFSSEHYGCELHCL